MVDVAAGDTGAREADFPQSIREGVQSHGGREACAGDPPHSRAAVIVTHRLSHTAHSTQLPPGGSTHRPPRPVHPALCTHWRGRLASHNRSPTAGGSEAPGACPPVRAPWVGSSCLATGRRAPLGGDMGARPVTRGLHADTLAGPGRKQAPRGGGGARPAFYSPSPSAQAVRRAAGRQSNVSEGSQLLNWELETPSPPPPVPGARCFLLEASVLSARRRL